MLKWSDKLVGFSNGTGKKRPQETAKGKGMRGLDLGLLSLVM